MALTKHQKYHLDAVIANAEVDKLEPLEKKKMLARGKGVVKEDYDSYLTSVKSGAQAIIDSGVFPKDLEPSDIHDYLEK